MTAADPHDPRTRADARLDAVLEDAAVRDPRPAYRHVLKFLKDHDEGAFRTAVDHFQSRVVPACLEGDPLAAWLEYGLRLAGLLGEGLRLEVDETGRARPTDDPATARGLVLHLPDRPATPALILRWPRRTSAAQQATIELLVFGRQTASAYR